MKEGKRRLDFTFINLESQVMNQKNVGRLGRDLTGIVTCHA
jgi:hypothetical protein